jgi:hypothetical protein
MEILTDDLRRLREDDAELADILDTYAEIRRVYGGAVEATHPSGRDRSVSSRSARVTVSAQPTASLSRPIPATPRRP